MNIAAIMPCRGRAEQTATNVRRLLATAAYGQWQLICVGAQEDMKPIARHIDPTRVVCQGFKVDRLSYWQALAHITAHLTEDVTHLVNLANDLIPGMHWLRRAVDGYRAAFGGGPGLLGFNGDSHEVGHSCHFLISRTLLDRYGGWPTVYQHDFGDTELCQRAIADGLYAKAPWAMLFHNHPFFGADNFDEVYQEGRNSAGRDQQIYEWRRQHNWPPYSETSLSLANSPYSSTAARL